MIAHSIKTLVLHPSKTGGTSLEHELIQRELPESVGCQLTPPQKQMFAIWTSDERHHWPLGELLSAFPFLRDYRRVVTVRNPYDRITSEYRYQVQIAKKLDPIGLNEAIVTGRLWDNAFAWHRCPQHRYWDEKTEILHMDSLNADFAKTFGGELRRHKMKTSSIEESLSPEAKDIISKEFSRDFEVFGFSM